LSCYVLDFQEIDQAQIALVGGKGAHLGELSRIDGISVPAGFCVTTEAFRRIMADAPSLLDQLNRLAALAPEDREAVTALSAAIRQAIEAITIPNDIATAISTQLDWFGDHAAYAVRSSATAEDLPSASFAGQQDTYLNVIGQQAVLQSISRCWASLFSERAVTYRLRNGIDQRTVQMAVVVQRMVFPDVSGILFTADPITGNRKVASNEASFGLGEALVSGLVNADVYKVRDGIVIDRTIASKQLAIASSPAGGTQEEAIPREQQEKPTLTDAQAVHLAALGRRIEAHFGRPQDIEWCLAEGEFQIVQSRPITTLFPVPVAGDNENHVYVSVGHQQMMTDPFKPLGISFWQMMSPRPMAEAGGRLFVDVTQELAKPASRNSIMAMLGKSDPLIGDALQTIVDREGFLPPATDDEPVWTLPGSVQTPIETDPAIVEELIEQSRASNAALQRELQALSGTALLDAIQQDAQELWRSQSDPRSMQVVLAGMEAAWWLNDHLQEWLGEKNVADTLIQSVPNNVTSEMGLALLDVADAIRPYPEVVAYLEQVVDDDFLEALPRLPGGPEARDAIQAWLDRYGMRCTGEIDITRPRWRERPSTLIPLILSNIRNFAPGEAQRRFAQGLQEAQQKEQEVLERLRALPDGAEKATETKEKIDRVRTFAGYREYPKYGMVNRYFIYKQALLQEAERLVQAGVLDDKEDIFYLRFNELQEAVRTHEVNADLFRQRKAEWESYQALTPPRVMTSDGEVITGAYRREDLVPGALAGLPVSSGTVEGRARVILDMTGAHLEPGDILVTAYTDPSWTPLFVTISGLVTEVGGLMTHGAVIAREYGLPAVVGVVDATRLIRDGQRIRVHGTDGYVEILDS
jgi:phosphoenolpyruvate synthase/pyruvate phosphate dikinase